MSFLLGVLLTVLGVVAAYTASQWSDINNSDLVKTVKDLGVSVTRITRAHDLLASLAVS